MGANLIYLSFTIHRVIQSKCLGGLVTYFALQSELEFKSSSAIVDINKRTAYWYAAGLVLCPLFTSMFTYPFMLPAFQIGMQIRVACTSMIYQKVNNST